MSQAQPPKSSWPKWFPSPRSWFRAVALGFLLVGISAVINVLGFWTTASIRYGDRTAIVASLIFLFVIVPFILISYTHHILWGYTPEGYPNWLPGPKSLWAGFYGWLVAFLSLLVASLIVIPFLNLPQYQTYDRAGNAYRILEPREGTQVEKTFIISIWFATAAYLYQAEEFLRRNLLKALNRKAKND
jgi:hypothetical protein